MTDIKTKAAAMILAAENGVCVYRSDKIADIIRRVEREIKLRN